MECGVGNGLENNTLYLLMQGWQGLWIEAHKQRCKRIACALHEIIQKQQLRLAHAVLDSDNGNEIIKANLPVSSIDLLSLDIDGNEWYIFDSLTALEARVVVIEYNAKWRPPLAFCVEYRPDLRWSGDDYFGASLQFLETQMRKKGYRLVGCSLSGVNAFFVKETEMQNLFLAPYTAEKHYQPPRYELCFRNGFPHSYKSVMAVYRSRHAMVGKT